jgi:chemotaxis signal transduction protein
MLTETHLSESSHLLRCDINDESYGIDMSCVQSIQRTDRLRLCDGGDAMSSEASVPDLENAQGLVGWLPDGERQIPVISLISKLGRSHVENHSSNGEGRRHEYERIIVFTPPESIVHEQGRERAHPWGILVDRVSQVVKVSSDCIHPLPDILVDPSTGYFQGVVKLEEELFLLLSSERLHPYTWRDNRGAEATVQIARTDSRRMRLMADHGTTTSAQSHDVMNRPRQMVVFSLEESSNGDRPLMFGLSISQVPEILVSLPMIPVPAGQDFISGLLFWRGVPVPVIDLTSRMVIDPTSPTMPSGSTRFIITRDQANGRPDQRASDDPFSNPLQGEKTERGVMAAFIIQAGIRILRLPFDYQPCTRSVPLKPQMVRGMVELEDETLVIPDIGAILTRDL